MIVSAPAFSLATQTGFSTLRYGFDTSQYRLIANPLYIKIFQRTLVMAALGSLLTILIGYPVAYWMARYLTTYKMLALLLIVTLTYLKPLDEVDAWLESKRREGLMISPKIYSALYFTMK